MDAPMRRFLFNGSLQICPLRIGLRLFACATLLLLTPLMSCRESVRPELARLQQNRGYRLVSVRDNKVFTLSFAERTLDQSKPFIAKGTANTGTVSPDGKRVALSLCLDPGIVNLDAYRSECPSGFVLAIVDPDGSDLREYRDFANPGPGICWSHDMSKLVLTMNDGRQALDSSDYLQIVDLKSGRTEVISDGSTAFVDSQCWSPDDKQIVYTVNKPLGVQTVRRYDVKAKKSKISLAEAMPHGLPMANGLRSLSARRRFEAASITGFVSPLVNQNSFLRLMLRPAFPGPPIRGLWPTSAAPVFPREHRRG